MDEEEAVLERTSLDTLGNINEDVTNASEFSTDSRNRRSESIFSGLRLSLDGTSNNGNVSQILQLFSGQDDAGSSLSTDALGPNSIHDLTLALDAARLKLNRALKTLVRINGGLNVINNLTRPSTKDIPPIQLQSLGNKISNAEYNDALLGSSGEDFKSFEQSYKGLTADVLISHSQAYELGDSSCSRITEPECKIPEVFEDADFRLDNPRIFREVMEGSRLFPELDSADGNLISNNSEVQDKLSSYLDQVEVQLIHEIAKTSENFFNTLGDIEDIKSESRSCVSRFDDIKHKLLSLESNQAKKGIEILDLIDERRNVNHLESTLLQLKQIKNAFKKAQDLYEKEYNLECLNWIDIIENLIQGVDYESYKNPDTISDYPKLDCPLVNLNDLPALFSIKSESNNLKSRCGKRYISEFSDLLISDLHQHCKSVPVRDTMNRIVVTVDRLKAYDVSTANKLYTDVSPELKSSLQIYINSLAKSGFVVEAYSKYQILIILEIKSIIRAGLPKSKQTSQSAQDNFGLSASESGTPVPNQEEPRASLNHDNNTLSDSIKNLGDKEFNTMMRKIYANLSECFRRLTAHQKVLLDISLTSLSQESSQQLDVMSLDISVAINKAIEITQIRLVKILNVRLEQLADLPILQYLYMYLNSSAYLLECELINPGYNVSGPGSSLNDWVKNHVEYFIYKFHSNSVKHLASICGTETWKEYSGDLMNRTQALIDVIVSYASFVKTGDGFNGDNWKSELLNIYESGEPEGESSVPVSHPPEELTKLSIKGEQYFVPQIIIEVVQCIAGFLQLATIFSSKRSGIEQNLLTYLKVLNSRISQAILNAGATRTAGLKHITTKHLALCIQTIDFLIAFLGQIEAIFLPYQLEFDQMKDTGDVATFIKVISNFKDHKSELFAKLVSIMRDRTLMHCKSITAIDLSVPLKSPQQCHQYMEILVKETLTVAKVLGKYLRTEDTHKIMGQIFENYEKLLTKCYCEDLPKLKDLSTKHTLLKDMDYFRVRLADVNGYGESGQRIWESVNEISTEEEARMNTIMHSSAKSGVPEVELTKLILDEKAFEKEPTEKATEKETAVQEAIEKETTEKEVTKRETVDKANPESESGSTKEIEVESETWEHQKQRAAPANSKTEDE